MIGPDGFKVYDPDPQVLAWVNAARPVADRILADPVQRAEHLRHGQTWFVGVNALPNGPDGAIGDVPLGGRWRQDVPDLRLHAGQLSVVFPGYPRQDANQSDANHSYRLERAAAHMDGLLPLGPARRRFACEHHAYILGLPLTDVRAAPTVVWPGSHTILQAALRDEIGSWPVDKVDITDAYHTARRRVFDEITPSEIRAKPGQAYLIHPFLLHGMAPWLGAEQEPRMVAFFRPEYTNAAEWLTCQL